MNVNPQPLFTDPAAVDFDAVAKSLTPRQRDYLEVFGNVWGKRKVMPGTCERCVWGRGKHSMSCRWARFKLGAD